MAQDKPLVIEGRFGLPDDRHRSYGRIEYSHQQGVRVHLVDTNLVSSVGDLEHPAEVDALHGEALGGEPLSLLNLFPTGWTSYGVGPRAGNVCDGVADVLLRGAHVRSADEVGVGVASSELYGLKDFLIGGAVDRGPLRPAADQKGLADDSLAIRLGDGAELILLARRQRGFSRDGERSELRAFGQWTFDPPRPLPSVERDYIGVLQDLVLFSTRRQSYLTSLTVRRAPEERARIEVVRQPHPRPREERRLYALALNLGQQDEPAAVVSAWFDLRRRLGPVWNLFFAVVDRFESLLEDRLLGLLAFAEGYHRALHDQPPLSPKEEKSARAAIKKALPEKHVRRVYNDAIAHANSQTQRDRLDHLVGRALDVLADAWDLDAALFVAQLIHTRNWLVHWGTRQRHAVEDSDQLIDLVRRLTVVLYVNLLLDLGLTPDGARQVIGSGWRLEGLP